MATRLYLCAAEATPVTPAFAAWQETDGALRRRMRTFTGGDTLADGSGQASTAGNTQLHRQYVSDRLAAGITFTSGVSTFTCQIQGRESAANDNIINRVRCVKVVSEDGNTIRATLIALGNATSVVEWNTALRNLTFLNATAATATYTTVAGDRLVVEVGHDDSGGTSVSGTLRFGADSGGTGDLGINETDTTTTLRPWFESSVNLTFPQAVAGDLLGPTGTLFAGTTSLDVEGATLSTSQLFAGKVALVVSGATIGPTGTLFAGEVTAGGGDTVEGAFLGPTGALFSGSTSLRVAGATIGPTGVLFSGSTAVRVSGAFLGPTSALFAGSLALRIAGAFLGPTGTLFAGATRLMLAGATLSTSQLFAGAVSQVGTIGGAFLGPTGTLFAGSAGLQAAGAFLGPTSTLFAGRVALVVGGATIPSGSTLFAGAVTAAGGIAGAFLGPTGALFPGAVVGGGLVEPIVMFRALGPARVFRSTSPPLDRLTVDGGPARVFRSH